jgi:hypothetical protein
MPAVVLAAVVLPVTGPAVLMPAVVVAPVVPLLEAPADVGVPTAVPEVVAPVVPFVVLDAAEASLVREPPDAVSAASLPSPLQLITTSGEASKTRDNNRFNMDLSWRGTAAVSFSTHRDDARGNRRLTLSEPQSVP